MTERRVLDSHDLEIWVEGFCLFTALDQFLRRRTTQEAMDAGLLDRDAVDSLVAAHGRMMRARAARMRDLSGGA